MTPSKVATKIATIASCRNLAYLSALTKLVEGQILCEKIQEYLQLTFGLLINTNQGNLEQKSGLQVASSPIYAILCQFVRKKSKIFKSGNWVINQDLIRLFPSGPLLQPQCRSRTLTVKRFLKILLVKISSHKNLYKI